MASTTSAGTLFGPVFWWDVVRISRRGLWHWARIAFAVAILGHFYLYLGSQRAKATELADHCAWFAERYCWIQFLVVMLLTPALTAGAFLEERRQQTLPLLLASMMNPAEVVLGKLMGRLLGLLTVVLTGLPVLALLQFLGGIPFGSTLLYTLLAVLTMMLLAMHGIVESSKAKTVTAAILQTYGTAGFHFGSIWLGCLLVSFLVSISYDIALFSRLYVTLAALVLSVLLACLSLSRLIRHLPALALQEAGTESTSTGMPSDWSYLYWRIQGLLGAPKERWEYRIQPTKPDQLQQDSDVAIRYYRIPEVGERPVCWKDVNFPIQKGLNKFIVVGSLVMGVAITIFVICAWGTTRHTTDAFPLMRELTRLHLYVVTLLVGWRAATILVKEREANTLEDQLIWPWKAREILWEKWWGVVLRFRWLLTVTFVIVLPTLLLTMPMKAWWLWPLFGAQLTLLISLGIFVSLLCRLHSFWSRLLFGILLVCAVSLHPLLVNALASQLPPVLVSEDVRLMKQLKHQHQFYSSDIDHPDQAMPGESESSNRMLITMQVVRYVMCLTEAWSDTLHLRYYRLTRPTYVQMAAATRLNAKWPVPCITIVVLLALSGVLFGVSAWMLRRYRVG
jgi:ABC-type transport system involved in multi-copper enzyme maturation permease subunit